MQGLEYRLMVHRPNPAGHQLGLWTHCPVASMRRATLQVDGQQRPGSRGQGAQAPHSVAQGGGHGQVMQSMELPLARVQSPPPPLPTHMSKKALRPGV